MAHSIKISAIIPTCDRPQYLPEAIASICAQSLQPIEIIVANNGKEPIPEGSLGADVQVLNLAPYVGASAARNAGAKAASGEYLAFLDDDDKWDKDFLYHLHKSMVEKSADYIIGDVYVFDENMLPKLVLSFSKFPRGVKEFLYGKNPGLGGGNFLVKSHAFFAVGGFDENVSMSEDALLPFEILMAGYTIAGESKACYHARKHPGPRVSHGFKKKYMQFYHKAKERMTYKQRFLYILNINKHLLKVKFKRIIKARLKKHP